MICLAKFLDVSLKKLNMAFFHKLNAFQDGF